MSADAFAPEDSAVRCPPDLTPDHFAACAAIEREIAGWDALALGLARGEHAQLVWAEAWLSHLDEVYVTRGCRPYRGDENAYIERLVVDASRDIHVFLSTGVPVWRPGLRHPRLHRAVDHIVGLRVQARGGGCELCRADVFLELHHLHYRSFGHEVPSDVMRLCRRCHAERHRACGYPQGVEWRDSMQWSTE